MKVSVAAVLILCPAGASAFFPTLLAAANGYLSNLAGGYQATVMKPPSYGVSKYSPGSSAPATGGATGNYLGDLTKNTGYPSLSHSVASMNSMAQSGSSSGAGYLDSFSNGANFNGASYSAPSSGASYLDAMNSVTASNPVFSSNTAPAAGNYLSTISRGGGALKPPSKRMWSPRDRAPITGGHTGGYLDNLTGGRSSSFSSFSPASSSPASSWSPPSSSSSPSYSSSSAPAAANNAPPTTASYLSNIGGGSSSSGWGPVKTYAISKSSYRLPSGNVGSSYLNRL